MDTITHGIAGALIGKAVFRGEDLYVSAPMNRGRVITWSLMLGALFPDSDVLRDLFSRDPLLIVTWHRSITHSLLMLPLWALVLAAITRAIAKSRKWDAPSFAALSAVYGVGILSHILLDLVTSFGTMIWSPLGWSRPAWDLIFIIDFTFTAILLVPQLLAWVYSQPEKMRSRAVGMWLVFMPAPFLVARAAEAAGAPVSNQAVLRAMILLAVVFLLPAARRWGLKTRYVAWNRAGFAVAFAYIALAFFAHRVALARIQKFAELDHLQVEAIGALPLPPSPWRWDGLVRGPHGVYELRMNLADKPPGDEQLLALEHRYYPDAPPNSYIEAAKRLPEVQKVLWFARFPVIRFHKEGEEAIVEISDIRFRRERSSGPPAFTYRVRLDASGRILSKGWLRN